MMKSIFKKWHKKLSIVFVFFIAKHSDAIAGTTDLPFATTMSKLQGAISGPFLLSAAIIMIVITCVMLAFGEWGDGFKKIINIVLWLSIAFAASDFVMMMFPGSGAVF